MKVKLLQQILKSDPSTITNGSKSNFVEQSTEMIDLISIGSENDSDGDINIDGETDASSFKEVTLHLE